MGSERVTRRLAAIVAADVAGYSRLIAADEEGTYVALRGHRTDLIDPKIKEFGGRIANTAGDSLLIEFSSVVDALRCSLDIQGGMRERNQQVPSTQRIEYRIGVNLGDVIEADGDLLGDGVNVAARLETIAAPGGVVLSSAAYEQVRGRVDVEFVDMGNWELKNIPTPARVYAVSLGEKGAISPRTSARFAALPLILLIVLGGALVWWIGSWASSDTRPRTATKTTVPVADDQPSIAVLPFANKSDDSAQDYFSDGLTEDVITDLSKISSLAVMARGSSFQYRNSGLDSLKAGQELGVSYVLTGSVRKSGSRVRINTWLVDVASGKNIWGARYDGGLEEVFALQDEVTKKIVDALKINLSAKEKRTIGRRYTNSVEAYDYFLKGRREMGRFNRVGNLASRPFFENAIQLDSTFANAFAFLAWSYVRGYSFSWDKDPEASLFKAATLARRAVDLGDNSSFPYMVLGLVQLYQLQHSQAVSSLEKALELNPNYADGLAMLAFILNYSGRPEKAAKLMGEAMQLNPFYPYVYLNVLGQSRFLVGEYDKAAELFTQAAVRNPADTQVAMWLAASQAMAGETEAAQWAISELLVHNEGYTIQRAASRLPFKDQRRLDLVAQGLRKAGLPQ